MIAPALGLALLAAACAVPSSRYGIALAPGAASPELQDLARRAAIGDKYAQLDLGIRYEEGSGVPRDLIDRISDVTFGDLPMMHWRVK